MRSRQPGAVVNLSFFITIFLLQLHPVNLKTGKYPPPPHNSFLGRLHFVANIVGLYTVCQGCMFFNIQGGMIFDDLGNWNLDIIRQVFFNL